MKLDAIRIVLVATTHPGNIGSTARAMKTMGFSQLVLVTPKMFPDSKATELASGADDILHNAVVTASLDEALAGCQLVFATSARPRDIAMPGMTPNSAANQIAKLNDVTQVALVFGREHAGLTNEELLRCHYHITIPSDETFSSLNLAQAVQVITYELRCHLLSTVTEPKQDLTALATADDLAHFYLHLEKILIAIDFLKPSNPRKLFQRLRRLFNRIQLERNEVHILRGILTHIQNALEKE